MLKVSDCYNRPPAMASKAMDANDDVQPDMVFGCEFEWPITQQPRSENMDQWQKDLYAKCGLKPPPTMPMFTRGAAVDADNGDHGKAMKPPSMEATSNDDNDDDYCEIVEVRSIEAKGNQSTPHKRKREYHGNVHNGCGLDESMASVKRPKVTHRKRMPAMSRELKDVNLMTVLEQSVDDGIQFFLNVSSVDMENCCLEFLEIE
jgi:hypothetical protein